VSYEAAPDEDVQGHLIAGALVSAVWNMDVPKRLRISDAPLSAMVAFPNFYYLEQLPGTFNDSV
jgi:hypothetical protein